MDLEARTLIAEAYRVTEQLLKDNKENLKKMAEALLEKETLNYEDVEKLLGAPPHGKKHLVSPVDFENQLKQQAELGKSEAESI
jgi:spastic paraplegia protein 7